MTRFWDYARKAGVAFLGTISTALSMGLLPQPWDKLVTALLAILTYYGVFAVRNVDPRTERTLPAGSDTVPGGGPAPL